MRRLVPLALIALVAAVAPARAATPTAGIIDDVGDQLTWTGSFDGLYPLTPVPDVLCVAGECDTFTIEVALGTFWETTDGAVEVSIRWPYDGITDLDLIVARDGEEVARSAALDSNAESVFLPEVSDGTYTVSVVPSNNVSDAGFAPIAYEGLAEVELFSADGPGNELLPNLVVTPPHNFHVATAANLVPFPENPVLSCYPEETVESEAHPTRCLRFDQTIANVGDGPLQLRFKMDQALTDPRMVQRIFTDDGGYTERFADEYELHAVHGHVHYKGFGRSFLYPYDAETGARTGDGTPASIGNKVGFCVIDVLLLDDYWGAPGNGPRVSTFPTCNVPQEVDDDGVWMVQGIQVGWADVYGWNLADQYIDITGLPDGVYELEQIANPTGSVTETDAGDNCASTVIEIAGDVVTPLSFHPDIPCTTPIILAG